MNLKKYRTLIVLAVVSTVLSALLLFGPGSEEKKANPFLWNKSLVKIEFDGPEGEHHVVLTRDAGLLKDTFNCSMHYHKKSFAFEYLRNGVLATKKRRSIDRRLSLDRT